MATSEQKVRVWRASRNATAGIQLSDETIEITANKRNSIAIGNSGIGVVSKSFTFGMTSENIRHAGLFVQTPDFAAMIPSTIVTPLPKRIPFPPLGFITTALKSLPVFISALQSIRGDK